VPGFFAGRIDGPLARKEGSRDDSTLIAEAVLYGHGYAVCPQRLPLVFDDAEVRVGMLPYESGDQLALLRATHGATHVFRRVEGTRIEAVAFVATAPDVGDSFKTVKLKKELGLAAAMMRNALIGHLHALPRKVYDFRPITFLADESKENLLSDCPISGVKRLRDIGTRHPHPWV
jgi:hypothetical protein